MPLKPKDKKVVDAFYARRSMDGVVVSTDGKRLIYNHGSETMATWEGNKVVVDPKMPYVKSQEAVLRYMRKSFPKNVLKESMTSTEAKLHRLLGELRQEADEADEIAEAQGFKEQHYQGSQYTSADLTKEARSAVKGLGKYVGWTLKIPRGGGNPSLQVFYMRKSGDTIPVAISVAI